MRKYYLVVTLFLLCSLSCTKKVIEPSDDFYVNGITDITISPNSRFVSQQLEIEHATGAQQNVTLSVLGLPIGIQATIKPESGIPTFSTVITYRASDSAIAGKYALKLHVVDKDSTAKDFEFNLTVPDCIDPYIGTYTARNECSSLPGTSTYTAIIEKSKTDANTIIINNFVEGVTLYAKVNCGGYGFEIPEQVVNGISYTGEGTGTANENTYSAVYIQYTFDDPDFGTGTCNVMMGR